MSRFFFHVISPRGDMIDAQGVELPVLDPALAAYYVSEVVAENGTDSLALGEILVVDHFGCAIARVPMSGAYFCSQAAHAYAN